MSIQAKLIGAVYEDLARPVMREVGDTLAGVVRVALSPANLLVWSFDQAVEYASSRVSQILEERKVPKDRVVPPRVEIAGPAIAALRIADQDEVLRRLYLNLLATAMDGSNADKAHPAFVEIVKQLTRDEARVVPMFTWLDAIGSPPCFPLIEVVARLQEGGYIQALSRFTALGSRAGCERELSASSIDNFVRLGLSIVQLDRKLTDDSEYQPLVDHSWVAEMKSIAESRPGCKAEIRRGLLEVTQFGFDFAHACTGGIECLGIRPTELGRDAAPN